MCAPAARGLIKVKTGSKEDTLKFSFNALECVLTIGMVDHFKVICVIGGKWQGQHPSL